MMQKPAPQLPQQKGFVVIMLLLILTLGVSSYLLSEVQFSGLEQEREKKTTQALKQAKKALISRMITLDLGATPNEIGTTACPDEDDDGSEEACGQRHGRLPFNSLNIDELRDGHNERLWYITNDLLDSGALPRFNIRNINNPANLLSLDGIPVLAVIIAPGPPVNNLQKAGRPSNDITHYLEDENANLANDNFTRGTGLGGFNDRVIAITVNDVIETVGKRVLEAFSQYIEDIEGATGTYPYAENDGDAVCDAISSDQIIGRVPLTLVNAPPDSCNIGFDKGTSPNNVNYRDNVDLDYWWNYVAYTVSPDCTNGGDCIDSLGDIYVELDGNKKKYILFFSGLPLTGLINLPPECAAVNDQDQESIANLNNPCHFFEDIDIPIGTNNNSDGDRKFFSNIGINDIVIGYE